MANKPITWGSLEPKPIENPKVFTLTGDEPPLVKGVLPSTTKKKKKPAADMYFKKGGLVKGKKGKKYI